ncbi:hypothetical protein KO561_12790 [Radiobacillus kanasensis]|uniref:hypothetical protein n=1 Tax=Radiobacillus kanasensis TaxID=2844358 RepID=UPI001E571792|nr:hypothetical protein [Radiobacillus kanasensis]UFT98079.1 hypothetical protein KO561_12790 [Radiobacillus kanasensis]
MKNKIKDISILIVGFLSTAMGFLATLNIKFEWLTEASINSFGAFFVATGMLIAGVIATWKNTYVKDGLREKALKAQKKTNSKK